MINLAGDSFPNLIWKPRMISVLKQLRGV